MQLYIPKYSEPLTSYLSIIQLYHLNLMYSELESKIPYMEGVKFLLAGIIEICPETYFENMSTEFLPSN